MDTGKTPEGEKHKGIFLVGSAGLAGAAILAKEKREDLLNRFRPGFIDRAAEVAKLLPGKDACRILEKAGARAVEACGAGGVFAGLWRLGEALKTGMEADLRRIPVRQETVEICEFFGLNLYQLFSGGCFLAAAAHTEDFISFLEAEGLQPVLIGRTAEGNDRILRNRENIRYLTKPAPDELYRVFPERAEELFRIWENTQEA